MSHARLGMWEGTRPRETEPKVVMYLRDTDALACKSIAPELLHGVTHRLTDDEVHELISEKDDLVARALEIIHTMDYKPTSQDHNVKELFTAFKYADFEEDDIRVAIIEAFDDDENCGSIEGIKAAEKRVTTQFDEEMRTALLDGMMGNPLAMALEPSDTCIYYERSEGEWERQQDNIKDAYEYDYDKDWSSDEESEPDVIEPKEYLFEIYLNDHLSDHEVDKYVIEKYRPFWTCKDTYCNPFTFLTTLISHAKIHVGQGVTPNDKFDFEPKYVHQRVPFEAWSGPQVFIESIAADGHFPARVFNTSTTEEAQFLWDKVTNKEEYNKIANERNEKNKQKLDEYSPVQEPNRKKQKTDEDAELVSENEKMSPALLASYIRVLKMILVQLEQIKTETDPRQFSAWCRIIPHQVIGDFGVYDEAYYSDLHEEIYYRNEGYDSSSEEEESEPDTDEEVEMVMGVEDDQDEFAGDVNLEFYEEEEEEIQDGVFASKEEIEHVQSNIDIDIANRWLHIDTSETETVPIIYHDWHEKIDTEAGPALVDISGIESIDVRSQINEPVDEELPPSLHLDILRVLRRSGVRGETPFAIAEGFFSLREYIYAVLKQVILQKLEQEDSTISQQDIEKAVQMVGRPLYSAASTIETTKAEQEDTDNSLTYYSSNEDEEESLPKCCDYPEQPFATTDKFVKNYDHVELEQEQDLSFVVNMIPIPESTLEEDILSCVYIPEDIEQTSNAYTIYTFAKKQVVALSAIVSIRCNSLPTSTVVNVQELVQTKMIDVEIDAETFYDYLRYLFSTNQEILFEHKNPHQLEILQTLFPLTEDTTCDLDALLQDTKFTDLTLQINGHSFKVHKDILNARSEYFANMFGIGLSESAATELDLSDVIPSEQVGKLMLEYIYTDYVELNVESAIELLPVAHYFMLSRLTGLCELVLARGLSEANVEAIFRVATHFESQELYRIVESFIVNNENILNDASWTQEEKQYFKSIREQITIENVIEKLENTMKQIQEQALDKFILNRLVKYWKEQCIQFIARHYDDLAQDIKSLGVTLQKEIRNVIVEWGFNGDGKNLIVPYAEINLWALEKPDQEDSM